MPERTKAKSNGSAVGQSWWIVQRFDCCVRFFACLDFAAFGPAKKDTRNKFFATAIRYPPLVPDNGEVEAPVTPPVSAEEKRALIEEMLGHPMFGPKAKRAKPILSFLLERHLLDPDSGPTAPEIFERVWGPDADVKLDPGITARVHAGRLRKLLKNYFRSKGARQELDLAVVNDNRHGYRLEFKRRSDHAKTVMKWFWGAYLDANREVCFVITDLRVAERMEGQTPFISIMRIYRQFAMMLQAGRLELRYAPSDDYENAIGYYGIVVGDDQCFTDPESPAVSEFYGVHGNYLAWATVSGHFTLSLKRDKLGRTVVFDGDRPMFRDSLTRGHVLLTRFRPLDDDCEQTIVLGRNANLIERVAEFVTSSFGLILIDALPLMRKESERLKELWKNYNSWNGRGAGPGRQGGAPAFFQIVFSADIDPSLGVVEARAFKDIRIEACSIPPWPERD